MPELISNYERVGIFVRNLLFFLFFQFFQLDFGKSSSPVWDSKKKWGVVFYFSVYQVQRQERASTYCKAKRGIDVIYMANMVLNQYCIGPKEA